jgi:hypothetical protein
MGVVLHAVGMLARQAQAVAAAELRLHRIARAI